jgi:hypothetical protein
VMVSADSNNNQRPLRRRLVPPCHSNPPMSWAPG